MNRVDKQRLRAAFSRGAGEYDDHALVQRRAADRVASRALEEAPLARRLLDVGTGTGALLARLRPRLPFSRAVGLDLALGMARAARGTVPTARFTAGDVEALPLQGGAFDLAVSSSTFQWLTRLEPAFAELFRVLAPGGVLCFAMFSARTLEELRSAHRAALAARGREEEDRAHRFFTPAEIAAALASAGFVDARHETEQVVTHHADVPALLRSLKRIGAGNAAPERSRGLADRRLTLDMMRVYEERHGCDKGIPATYEIHYALARRP